MKQFCLVILASFGFFLSQAQTPVLKGKLESDSGPLASATVSLIAADSSVLRMTVTDAQGIFQFEQTTAGRYFLYFTAVGFANMYSPAFTISEGKLPEFSTFQMNKQSTSLNNVTVVARKPLIEHKVDRMVVNVDASPVNVGSTALEVLEKSPGISVDREGNISLKGKDGVMVLVDGRPTQLSGADLANMLRNLTASQVDQIEIMTNPPAKFDASGNAGVINLKLKKSRQFGYNGNASVSYSQGRFPKTSESFNFNYRKGKINFFSNLSHNYRKRFQNLDIQRNFRESTTEEITSSFDQESRIQNINNNFSAKAGIDYFAGKKTTFGFSLFGFNNDGKFRNDNTTFINNSAGVLQNKTTAKTRQTDFFNNFSTNLNFRQLIDSAGTELTADIDYNRYNGSKDLTMNNYYFDANGQTSAKTDTLLGLLPQEIEILSGRIDYVRPLNKQSRLEAGLKSSSVITDNDARYDTLANGVVMRDQNRSNYFIYQEVIHAGYLNLSQTFSEKFSMQLGLRYEHTSATGDQKTTAVKFDRAYSQLFPTAYFQYKASDKHNLGVNYGRRIRRPDYESLNPFIEFLDRYTYQQGNPNLKPQFSHNIEISHGYKNIINTTLNYSKTTDIIQRILQQNDLTKETFMKAENIARQRQYGIAVSVNVPVTGWWTSNVYINAINNHFKGLINGNIEEASANMVFFNSTQQFKISKTLMAELSGFFRSAGIQGPMKSKSMGMLNIGLSQQVLKGQGSLRFNVRDVLFTQRFRAVQRYGNVDAAFQERGDNTYATIGFSYRFNKGKINGQPKRRTPSSSEEQNRVGGEN